MLRLLQNCLQNLRGIKQRKVKIQNCVKNGAIYALKIKQDATFTRYQFKEKER